MQEIFEVLRGTLDKSFLDNFRTYLSCHDDCKDFILISDYCIGNEKKPNDVIAFTIAPGKVVEPTFMKGLNRAIPADLKRTSKLNDGIARVLKDHNFFHVAFILDDVSGFLHSPHFDKRSVALKNIEQIKSMLKGWSANQPTGRVKFEEQIKRFSLVSKELEKRSANFRLYYQMILVSMLASVVSYYLSKETICRSITWFPDRDKMHDAFQKIYRDLFEINHWGLCFAELPKRRIPGVGYAIDIDGGKNQWFDPLVRLPDYIAGALADWNRNTNITSHDKHTRLVDDVIASNLNCNIIKIAMSREQWSFGFLPVDRVPNTGAT